AAEPLLALELLDDPEAGVLEDVRVLAERRVVVLPDPAVVDGRRIRRLDVVGEQRELSHPQISSANEALMWSAGRSGSGSQAWWKRRAAAPMFGSPRTFSTHRSGSRTKRRSKRGNHSSPCSRSTIRNDEYSSTDRFWRNAG